VRGFWNRSKLLDIFSVTRIKNESYICFRRCPAVNGLNSKQTQWRRNSMVWYGRCSDVSVSVGVAWRKIGHGQKKVAQKHMYIKKNVSGKRRLSAVNARVEFVFVVFDSAVVPGNEPRPTVHDCRTGMICLKNLRRKRGGCSICFVCLRIFKQTMAAPWK